MTDRLKEIREHLADVEAHGAREHWAYVDHVPWLLAEIERAEERARPEHARADVGGPMASELFACVCRADVTAQELAEEIPDDRVRPMIGALQARGARVERIRRIRREAEHANTFHSDDVVFLLACLEERR